MIPSPFLPGLSHGCRWDSSRVLIMAASRSIVQHYTHEVWSDSDLPLLVCHIHQSIGKVWLSIEQTVHRLLNTLYSQHNVVRHVVLVT
jgi:hypothetical protein